MRPLVAFLVLAGCKQAGTGTSVDFSRVPPAGTAQGPVAASFGNDRITVAELDQRFAEMNPYARARYQTLEQRRDYVEGLARFELLAQEAVRRGLHNDPDVVEAAKRVMVQELLKQELDEKTQAISESQVKQYYDAHRDDYVKPAMTRLSHIAFSKEHRAQAEAVLAQAKALAPMDYAAFGKLAREHSEDPSTKALDGDLRFLSDDELSAKLGPELTGSAASLERVGDVAPALVETAKALHVVKLQGRQQALNLSLEQASASIKQLLLNETRQARYRALLEKLKADARYEVSDEALSKVVVDPKAPTAEAKGPQPGFVPAPNPAPPEK
ncbi:MAG: peptidyl-prolyl cis-trans isomerase [Myxococcaceae bacterium]|nr:peptidyl-prolyl cis-trans isomerase [Myxococcaceae bacterium]